MAIQLFFIVMQLFFGIAIFYLTIAFVTGAPFVPSNQAASKSMIRFANIRKGIKVHDLGSGDGRLLLEAAKKGAIATGYEINPLLVLYTYVKKIISPYGSSITVKWSNFWTADLRSADVVFVYLLPWKMEKLEQKLIHDLHNGAIVISNSFIFPHMKLVSKDTDAHIYVFRKV
jgi:hypothetical protein